MFREMLRKKQQLPQEECIEILKKQLRGVLSLTLQRLKHVGFLYTFTSRYTRKHIRLMSFYKTFTTKDAIASISDSIRLVSKPLLNTAIL